MTKSQIQNSNQSLKSKYLNYLSFGYLFVIWILSFVIFTSICFADVSVNVPVGHWAYDELDSLNRAGLCDGSGLTSKPITRMDAARLVETAIGRIQEDKAQFSDFDEVRIKRAETSLNRLVEEFRPELVRLGITSVAKDDQPISNIRFKLADPMASQTFYADLKNSDDILFENMQGLHLKKGFNEITSIRSWIEFNEFIAVELEPAMIYSKERHEFNLKTGYVKLSYWNIELEAGKDSMWWGPGYHGAMLLSDNAYPLNLVRLRNAHPFTLPSVYEKLGKWNVDFFVAQLDKGRDHPHAKLGGLRIEWAPVDYFTFGVSRTALFGGNGRPRNGLVNYWNMFITKGEQNQDPTVNRSKQFADFDFKLNIPWRDSPFDFCTDLQLYGEWAGTDHFGPWQNKAPGYLGGILVSDLFGSQALDFRAEFAHTDAAWYVSGIYTNGYRYKGDVIGHHMGTSADDVFMRLSKTLYDFSGYFERLELGGQIDVENQNQFSPSQRKYEVGIDGTFYLSEARSVKLIYEYEDFRNFNNISGNKTHNNIFLTEADVKF